ncbi:unnamed protein product [Medioppia subpectinata]|uniref:Uncharacterized protein n=1 Tax=Medioppia subpectinata TaxID=1979941 RepID=A0A7R9Q173_9ACAR|nr:unnamed protein product [Medioppia subpectinata]CAG2108891.1 unnamed protein product [Medioppia subpectinata]
MVLASMPVVLRFLQWKTDIPVYISEDLNKKIWSRGNFGAMGRIRVRVEKANCLSNPEQRCLRVSLVEVSSFKNLKDAVVAADE